MPSELKEIETKALTLPADEREVLIKNLVYSFQDSPHSEIDEAWIQEAERRYENFKSGTTKGIPGEQIFAEIRRELGWRK